MLLNKEKLKKALEYYSIKDIDYYEKCNRCNVEMIVGVCSDKNCSKNGGLCYRCIHSDHLAHCSNCIPITSIKLEKFKQDECIASFVQYLKTVNEAINTLINDQIKQIIALKDFDYNSFAFLSQLSFWKNLTQDKNEWFLLSNSINDLFLNYFGNTLNQLKEKVQALFDCGKYYRYSMAQNCPILNYNINPNTSIITKCIEEDTLIFSPTRPGMLFSGFGLFSELTPNEQPTIILSNQKQMLSSKWSFTNYDIDNKNKVTLCKIEKLIELMTDTKYILNIKINKEIAYFQEQLFLNQKKNVNDNAFIFYEINGKQMLKFRDFNQFPKCNLFANSFTQDICDEIKKNRYIQLNSPFSTIFSFIQFYEKNKKLLDNVP